MDGYCGYSAANHVATIACLPRVIVATVVWNVMIVVRHKLKVFLH